MTAQHSWVTHLSCPRCGRTLDHRVPQNLCSCGSPLLVEYDLDGLSRRVDKGPIAGRPPTMWRYPELLPVADPGHVVSLGEGFTPLLPAGELGRRVGLPRLMVKDEGPNPTGTFKARGAACGVAMAVELGVIRVALPTAGNAGGAWACYGAAAGVEVLVALPADAPEVNRLECELYGADVLLVDGLIPDAAEAVAESRARRLVRRGHAQGAIPDRGEEDSRAGDRRAARVADAGRHRLSGRRRGWDHRDLAGDPAAPGHGLVRE